MRTVEAKVCARTNKIYRRYFPVNPPAYGYAYRDVTSFLERRFNLMNEVCGEVHSLL